jgi:dTDP-4-dehydrorhamnose reductase
MRILVTGSNGLLGQKLTRLLSEKSDVYLIATGRGKSVLPISQGEYLELDVCNAEDVERVVSSAKPDVVINTAAMTNVDQCEKDRDGCWEANVASVEHLIGACEKTKSHLIHLSTDFIFDGSHGPLDENEVASPVNYYGESKLAAEELIRKSKLDWAILRTVLVFGITKDMSRSNIVLWVKNSLEQGKEIQVVNDQFRTPTLAEDLATGCYLAAVKKAKGVFNISGKDFLSPYEIAVHTAHFFSLSDKLIKKTDSTQFTQPAKRPLVTGFVIDKARKELGYEPHSFIEGIKILSEQIASPDLA